MDRLVRMRTLATLLGVERTTLYMWRDRGLLPLVKVQDEQHVWESEINRMLAQCRHNMRRPLAYDDLRTGRVVLVPTRMAMQQLDLTWYNVTTLLQQERLEGVRLGGRNWHITQDSIDYQQEVRQYTPPEVSRIIGLKYVNSRKPFWGLVNSGRLTRHPLSTPRRTFISEKSLDAYLRLHLSPWLIPEIWREELMSDGRPLMTIQEIARWLNVRHIPTLQRKLEQERVGYINLPGGHGRRYSPVTFDAFRDMEGRPDRRAVAWWLGVHFTAINHWRNESLLHCELPAHVHNGIEPFYEACWVGIIQRWLSPGMDARSWIRNRSRSGRELAGRQLAAAWLEVAPEKIDAFAESGLLRGVCTPVFGWRFTFTEIRRVKSALRGSSHVGGDLGD